jgi:hypothetical protein
MAVSIKVNRDRKLAVLGYPALIRYKLRRIIINTNIEANRVTNLSLKKEIGMIKPLAAKLYFKTI